MECRDILCLKATSDIVLINKLYIKSKCIEVYEGFAPLSSNQINCNQILGHVADQD